MTARIAPSPNWTEATAQMCVDKNRMTGPVSASSGFPLKTNWNASMPPAAESMRSPPNEVIMAPMVVLRLKSLVTLKSISLGHAFLFVWLTSTFQPR